MSLLKSVPEGLKPQECKRTKLREPLPVPYVPRKDKVQEEVSRLRNLEIKTTIEKDTTLNFPVWQENGTREEAFLMHMMAVLDAIKKHGHFYNYKKVEAVHKEAKKSVESSRAGLSLLDGTGTKSKRFCKKKAREAAEKALAKAPDSESEAREAKEASEVNNNSMKAGFLDDLEKAKQAQSTAKGTMTAAVSKMLMFYSNLFSPESKYLWNKIVGEQIESDPYANLQGDSLDPRGMSHELLNNCVMFHLLTAFPINAAEQEKYCISNVLKKPQRINVRQFVRCVEQLNAYIAQMPCFYYSPDANASTKTKNVPFTDAELGAHVLHMCPLQWQDQYNMNKKGMTSMDICLLLTLLEAIECICTYEKGKLDTFEKPSKSPNKGEKGKKRLGTNSMVRVPKKVCFEKNCNLCKKHGGLHTMHNTRDCCRFEKDGKEKSSFRATKKGGYNWNPVNQNFAQLTNKIEKLEKALKKSGKKGKKRHYEDSNSDSE
jgi:hypothetical protein